MPAGEVLQFERMIGMTEENVCLVPDDEDYDFIGRQIFLRHAQDVLLRDGSEFRADVLPIVRILCVTAGEFVLGQLRRDLSFGAERAREAINETAPGRFEFRITDRLSG